MKRMYVTAIIVIVALLIAGTNVWAGARAEEYPREETLILAYPQDPAHLDHMADQSPHKEIRHLVFEMLFLLDHNQVPRPHLAKSAELSEDRLTWTIRLREDVTFHDGQPMTSEDVIASWGRFKQVGAKAYEFERVDEVVAIDNYTVEFRLSAPLGSLLESLGSGGGSLAIYPKWVIDEIGTNDLIEQRLIVGTGSYMVDKIVTGERYVFRRYDDYAQPGSEPSWLAGNRYSPMKYLDFRIIPDASTRVAALEAGDVDVIHIVPLDEAVRLEKNPDTHVTVTNPGARVYYKFNLAKGPFTDPLLREAVRAAIDPVELMTPVGDPNYWRINHCMRYQEEQWMWSDVADQYFTADLERGRDLVRQSSYNGEPIVFLATPGRAVSYPTVVPMDQTLRNLGLNVEIKIVDSATYSSLRANLDEWDIKHTFGDSMSMPVYLDASARDRKGNFWPGLPEEWHEMMAVVLEEQNQEIRAQAIERLHELHAELNNELWIGDVAQLEAARNNVKNVPPWYKLIPWNIEKE